MEITSNDQSVQLVFKPEERTVVAFPLGLSGKPQFSAEYAHLERAMTLVGITIPQLEREKFPNLKPYQRVIKLGDPDFGRAFYEIHFKTKMNPENFDWSTIE